MNQQNEITIDLMDLCKRILAKWKLLILFVLIGAVLGGGFGVYKLISDKKEKAEFAEKYGLTEEYYSDEVIESAQKLISEEYPEDSSKISEVENAIITYEKYTDNVTSMQSEIDKSLYYKLDPEKVPTLRREYYINMEANEWDNLVLERKVANIVTVYSNILTSDEKVQKMIDEMGIDTVPYYFKALFGLWNSGDILVLNVIGNTREECEKLVGIIDKMIVDETPAVQRAVTECEFEISRIGDNYTEPSGSGIASSISSAYQELQGAKEKITKIPEKFTSEQKEMYEKIISKINSQKDKEVEPKEKNEKLSAAITIIKNLIIGGILGVILIGVILVVKYVLSKKLRTVDDLDTYGLFNIGVLGKKSDKTDNDIEFEKIVKGIVRLAQNANTESISIWGDESEEINEIKEKLTDALIQNGISVGEGNDNPIVAIVQIDVTPYAKLRRLVEEAKQYDVKVLGCVVRK